MSMYNQDTEVLFPTRVIPVLDGLQGEEWHKLIEYVRSEQCAVLDRYAFVLMMVRMCGCAGCNADSFRAMRGCTLCAKQTVRRFRGGDREIVDQYQQMRREVEQYLRKNGGTTHA